MIEFEIVDGAMLASDVVVPPSPSLYNQILRVAQNADDKVQKVLNEIESGIVPAFRDYNNGAPVRVWTGTMKDYLAKKDSFPDGVLSVITDQNAEYIVSISNYENSGSIVKYSGGMAEAIFYKTINIPLTDTYGPFFVSPLFVLSFPEFVTTKPTSCVINVVGTPEKNMLAFIACSGTWSETQTQTFKVFSNLSNATGGITLEFRVRYNTSSGE
jgi:hypothetical protein